MKQLKQYLQNNWQLSLWFVLATAGIALLFLYKLGSLTHGLSKPESLVSSTPVGWHGIYHNPFYLPLQIIRSVIFYSFPAHGQTLDRLPNALLGILSVVSFSWFSWIWHGRRTGMLVAVLFTTSAWVLHISRYASYDVVYLGSISTLLLTHALLHRYGKQIYMWYLILFLWGILLTVPGMIWLIIAEIYLDRKLIIFSWNLYSSWWKRYLSILVSCMWIPLVIINCTRPGQLLQWLGLPGHIAGPSHLLKQLSGVFVHLFIRGPQYPAVWLGRTPLLDAFTLTVAVFGIYFYGSHWRTSRSRLLEVLFLLGIVLVALHGPVGFSILVPLIYASAAMGIAYLLHEWLIVFPLNPLARNLGIGLVTLLVIVSGIYNLRAYFVAWPHNSVTKTIFVYHR